MYPIALISVKITNKINQAWLWYIESRRETIIEAVENITKDSLMTITF